ncbi:MULTISPECIES: replication-relaxation family protein [Bacillus]|uniref:replication-relaxation family protein n=1 Tax=Bacillus TaxID=1386 RepID=UPI000C76F5E6|nr:MULTISPECIES: replication-relaxation family protein [Bacillus]MCP1161419.1 replication-relaxation family protein [Bacillus infantis]PLR70511.1 hypothetical protein CYJ37_23545 [Bacillus sp. UMB0728]
MADNALLNPLDPLLKGALTSSQKLAELPMATTNPYDEQKSPTDILKYLPPDGSMFGLFSDPYATMKYHKPREGNHSGVYWLNNRIESHSFTEHEIALIDFLAKHRIATRKQIERVVFPGDDRTYKIRDFLEKSRKRGIITAFSWITPCSDGRKKPLIYGLTRIGAEAAEVLFQIELPKQFIFQPIEFTRTKGPNMSGFFHDLVGNEFFSELRRLDRVISWERKPAIRLSDGTRHYPGVSLELIKDEGDFIKFWLETFRITPDWVDHVTSRFQKTQLAFEKLSLNEQPKRVIVILDSESRIPFVSKLAEEYMPSVEVRYTTDERILMGLERGTFLVYDQLQQTLKTAAISFLTDEHTGMTATEYFDSQTLDIEDDDEFED